MSFFEMKVCVFCVLLENDKTDLRQFFFHDLGENTCSLQSALKSNAPGLSGLKWYQAVYNMASIFQFWIFILDLHLTRYTHLPLDPSNTDLDY